MVVVVVTEMELEFEILRLEVWGELDDSAQETEKFWRRGDAVTRLVARCGRSRP